MSRDVTFDETFMMKPTSSQQVESGQIKEVLQWVKSDATCTLDNSILFEFSPEVKQVGDHVVDEDNEDVKNQGPEMGHSKILLQHGPEEIHVKPHGSLQI